MKREPIGYDAWNEAIIKAQQWEGYERSKVEIDMIYGTQANRCVHGNHVGQCWKCENE